MKPLLTAFVLGFALTIPAVAAPDEQKALRSVANIARMAIGTNCVDPDTTTSWTLAPPTATDLNGGTPNQKILVRVWHYGWALRVNPRPSNLNTIRSTLLDFINRQQQDTGASGGPLGHYATDANANEELTSSHYQLWAGAMAAAYLYAIADGGQLTTSSETSTRETAVRDALRKWWADEQNLYDRTYTNGELDAPGARYPSTHPVDGTLITNALRDDIYRLLRGLGPSQASNCSSHRSFTSSFVMQNLLAKAVPRLGQAPNGYPVVAKLYDTLCVYRMGQDWTLYFPNMRGVTGGLYWVEFRNAQIRRAAIPYNGVKPMPYPINMASLDPIPGVPKIGAATCPSPHEINQ